MDVTLPFWVIMRSGRRNVMNHIASRGAIFAGCGELCYHESYCDESLIMTIYGFLNIQFFYNVSSGVGLCPYTAYGRVYPYMGLSIPPQVLRGTKKNSLPTTIIGLFGKLFWIAFFKPGSWLTTKGNCFLSIWGMFSFKNLNKRSWHLACLRSCIRKANGTRGVSSKRICLKTIGET